MLVNRDRDRGGSGKTAVQNVQSLGSSPGSVQTVEGNYNSNGELPRFENSRNVERKNASSAPVVVCVASRLSGMGEWRIGRFVRGGRLESRDGRG